MNEELPRTITFSFKGGAKASGLSERSLRYAADHRDPEKRLPTVWYGGRRLITFQDLQNWLERVLSRDKPTMQPVETAGRSDTEAA